MQSTKILSAGGDRGYWPVTESGQLVVTQSMVNTFMDCPREVYYGTILGLRPRLESIPLTRGTWIHSLLEEAANGGDWRVKHEEMLEQARFEQFDEEVDALGDECYDLMVSYEWYWDSRDPLKPVAAELLVERPMFQGKALYRGKIDLIVQDEVGDVWLVDHKTHRTFPDWHYRELAFQHYSYLWACRTAPQYAALGIPQPKGFIYDYLKTSAIKKPTLTQAGKISRVLKPTGTSLPVFKSWLREQGMLTTIKGKELLAIEDPKERAFVEEFLVELQTQNMDYFFRRDKMEFTRDQERRQLKSFMATAKRLLRYDWSDPDAIERGVHSGYSCRYADLSIADLMHGTSDIEKKTRYKVSRNPLDYYDNKPKKKVKSK